MGGCESPGSVISWVLLSYRLPREPSTPRIALWRRLRRLGAVQIGDGLVGLPADARTREQLDWLAEEVLEAGGSAGVWLAESGSRAQDHALARELALARAAEYVELTAVATAAAAMKGADRVKILRRVRKQLREITRRDFFPPPERDAATAAVGALAAGAPMSAGAGDVDRAALEHSTGAGS